jgi:hypothetical protein
MSDEDEEQSELDDDEFSLNPENDITGAVDREGVQERLSTEKFTVESSDQRTEVTAVTSEAEFEELERDKEDQEQGIVTDPDHGLDLSPVEYSLPKKKTPLEVLYEQHHGDKDFTKADFNPVRPMQRVPLGKDLKPINLVYTNDGTPMLPIRFKVINDIEGPLTEKGKHIIRTVCTAYMTGGTTMDVMQKRVNRLLTGKTRGSKEILAIIDIYAILAYAMANGYHDRLGKKVEFHAAIRKRPLSELTIPEFTAIVRHWRIQGAKGPRPSALQCKDLWEQLDLRKDLFLDAIAKVLKALSNRHASDYHHSSQEPETKKHRDAQFSILQTFQSVAEEIFLTGKRSIDPCTGKDVLIINCEDVIGDVIKNSFLSNNFPSVLGVFELKVEKCNYRIEPFMPDVIEDINQAAKEVEAVLKSKEFEEITEEDFVKMTPDEKREYLAELKQERKETGRRIIE